MLPIAVGVVTVFALPPRPRVGWLCFRVAWICSNIAAPLMITYQFTRSANVASENAAVLFLNRRRWRWNRSAFASLVLGLSGSGASAWSVAARAIAFCDEHGIQLVNFFDIDPPTSIAMTRTRKPEPSLVFARLWVTPKNSAGIIAVARFHAPAAGFFTMPLF